MQTMDMQACEQAMRWISGEESTMDVRDVKTFLDGMIAGFRRRFSEENPGTGVPRFRPLVQAVPSLSFLAGPELAAKINADLSAHAEEEKPSEEPSRAVDSVLLVNAIGHVARLSGRDITSSRAQMILYCVYGSWLATHGSRLETEHPQAWRYGPVFPRAYRNGRLADAEACRDAYSRLGETDPELAALVSSMTLSMLRTAMADLGTVHVRSKACPYASVMRSNPKALGTQIPDSLIETFFTRR